MTELSPKERIKILSARLIALRNGAGEYSNDGRVTEIDETEWALRDAWQESRSPVSMLPAGFASA